MLDLAKMCFKYLCKCSKETFEHSIINGCFTLEENFPVPCTRIWAIKLLKRIS